MDEDLRPEWLAKARDAVARERARRGAARLSGEPLQTLDDAEAYATAALSAVIAEVVEGERARAAKIADDYAVRMEHAAAKRQLAGKPNLIPTCKVDAARSIAAAIRGDTHA